MEHPEITFNSNGQFAIFRYNPVVAVLVAVCGEVQFDAAVDGQLIGIVVTAQRPAQYQLIGHRLCSVIAEDNDGGSPEIKGIALQHAVFLAVDRQQQTGSIVKANPPGLACGNGHGCGCFGPIVIPHQFGLDGVLSSTGQVALEGSTAFPAGFYQVKQVPFFVAVVGLQINGVLVSALGVFATFATFTGYEGSGDSQSCLGSLPVFILGANIQHNVVTSRNLHGVGVGIT